MSLLNKLASPSNRHMSVECFGDDKSTHITQHTDIPNTKYEIHRIFHDYANTYNVHVHPIVFLLYGILCTLHTSHCCANCLYASSRTHIYEHILNALWTYVRKLQLLDIFIIWLIWYRKHATQYIRTQTHQQPQPIQDSYGWNTQKQQISSVERAIIRWQKERQKHKHISHASATITTAYIIGKTFEFYIQSCWFFRSNHSVFFEGARIKKLKSFVIFRFSFWRTKIHFFSFTIFVLAL